MKNLKQTVAKKVIKHFKRPLIALIIIVLVLLAAQVALDIRFWQASDNGAKNDILIHLVTDAVENLGKPAQTDAKTGDVYISEARLVLPPSTKVQGLRYLYENYTKPYDLRVTTDSILNLAENQLWVAEANSNGDPDAVMAKVPNLQACTRGVLASFGKTKDSSGLVARGKIKLSDGREIYLYSENKCDANLAAVANYLKQAKSY